MVLKEWGNTKSWALWLSKAEVEELGAALREALTAEDGEGEQGRFNVVIVDEWE